ncbi:conjugative transposon protein TraM [Dysgonomonas termitidis]|uniref:Conjugative transposon protein TraM n=1 Tax=Dysgonomonas termitidis TaxID=1516126 RepID=A0ABV9KSR3_9BACT
MEQENLNKGTPPPETAAAPEVKHEGKQESGKLAQKPVKPKKELTPAEMQKRRKMLVMPLFFLIFGAALWLIFAPSGKDREKEAQQAGLNVELPMPTDGGLVSDKRDAYEREAMRQKEQERMRSLQDFSTMFDQAEEPKQTESSQPEYYENPSARQTKPANNLQASANAYQDINKQLGSWYEEPAGKSAQELAVEERMNELERKLEEAEQRKATEDEQAAMLEKSYQMAARYMPQTAREASGAATGEAVSGSSSMQAGQSGKTAAQPVKQVRQNVVSLLAAPMSNGEFISAYSQPRNTGFLTAAGNEGVQDKNSIRACVYQTVTLTNGKEVQIRLLEPMRVGDMLIPVNTVITGSCRITGERLDVIINSIQYADNIIPVELLVYDTDGQRGISVPGSDEINAAKEVAATLANSAGTSIMISDNAGSQLAADMGKGLIQGASQYVSKKMSVVKVTLKANYRLLLLPKTQ